MNAADQRSWYELAASRSAQHQMDGNNGVSAVGSNGGNGAGSSSGNGNAGGGGGGGSSASGGGSNQLGNPASGDEVDMFFPSLDSGNSRARYYQQVHHAAQMHSAYNSAASHGNFFLSIRSLVIHDSSAFPIDLHLFFVIFCQSFAI